MIQDASSEIRQILSISDVWTAYAARVRGESLTTSPLTQGTSRDLGSSQQADPLFVGERRIIAPPPPTFRMQPWRENFIALARWSGRVLEKTDTGLIAVVVDDIDQGNPEEEAEIPMEEVSEADRPLIRPGALFYWSIGYRIHPSGQRSRESLIRFRRLPTWSTEEVEQARRRVDEANLGIESAEPLQPTDPPGR